MIIIYEEVKCRVYKFIHLNFDTGEYSIWYLSDTDAYYHVLKYRKLGYTFIHR